MKFAHIILMLTFNTSFAQFAELDGFPHVLGIPSNFAPNGPEHTSVTFCDLEHDGIQELIVTGRRDVYVLNYSGATGSVSMRFHFEVQDLADDAFEFCSPASIAHLSSDGVPWIVVGASGIRYYARGPDHSECDDDEEEGTESHCPVNGGFDSHQGEGGYCSHFISRIHAWKVVGGLEYDEHISDLRPHQRLTTPAVGDFDGDGIDELAFVGPSSLGIGWQWQGEFYCHVATTSAWVYSFDEINLEFVAIPIPGWTGFRFHVGVCGGYALMNSITCPAIGDLNRDGIDDVVLCAGYAIKAVSYSAGLTNGENLWGEVLQLGGQLQYGSQLASTDHPDGECIVPPYDFEVWDHSQTSAPILADLDADTQLDVFISTASYGLGFEGTLFKLNGSDGQIATQYHVDATAQELSMPSELAVADYNETGLSRIITTIMTTDDAGAWSGLRVRSWDQDCLPSDDPNGFPYNFVVSDHMGMDPGGIIDIYSPAVLPSPTGSELSVYATGRQFLLEMATAGNDHHFETLSNSYDDNSGDHSERLSAPVAGDLDRDGLMEIITTRFSSPSETQLHALETSAPFSPERNEWNGFRNGTKHKGLYAQPVSGTQPRQNVTWEGRIVVRDAYKVPLGYTLKIEPGTVVEFSPNAWMSVEGTLIAEGAGSDSIYFKADGQQPWAGLYLVGAVAMISKCVFHGGGTVYAEGGDVTIEHCRFYSMNIGLDLYDCENERFTCANNVIEDCAHYGIRGTLSAGTFASNTVQTCGRAGIYWVGNKNSTQQAPYFGWNHILYNGAPGSGIAGGYFNSTEAGLYCNTFADNYPNQIACENAAHLGMCEITGQHGNNELHANASVIWCGTCDGRCTCTPPPTNYAPLMRISKSKPYMYKGHNKFIYENDGVFVSNLACPNAAHQVDLNYFSAFGRAYSAPIDPNDPRFCRWGVFTAADLDAEPSNCLSVSPLAGPTAAALALKNAVLTEQSSSYVIASQEYKSIAETYPGSEESVIAAKGYLRSSIAAGAPYGESSDTLASTSEEVAEEETRNALFTESVWALASGGMFEDARPILDSVLSVAVESSDSTWSLFMLDVISLLEDTTNHGFSTGNRQPKRVKVTAFHDRVHELMGRDADRSTQNLDNAALPEGFALHQNYPNPFNPSTEFSFDLPEGTMVELKVFDILGREVATVADRFFEAGTHHISWDSRSTGTALASGVYIYQIKTPTFTDAKKMILLR